MARLSIPFLDPTAAAGRQMLASSEGQARRSVRQIGTAHVPVRRARPEASEHDGIEGKLKPRWRCSEAAPIARLTEVHRRRLINLRGSLATAEMALIISQL